MSRTMKSWAITFLCAGLVAAPLGLARADGARPGLTAFGSGAGNLLSPRLSFGPGFAYPGGDFSSPLALYPGASMRPSFAASLALSPSFALDRGYDLDIAQRFSNFDGLKSPLIATGNFLSLANGGDYAGITWMMTPSVTVRLGAAESRDPLNHFSFDPAVANLNGPLFGAGQSRSVIAGVNWSASDWSDIGFTAIGNRQSGWSAGFNALGNLGGATRVDTGALDVAARLKLGNGWVTTASYAEGFTQLDQRPIQTDGIGAYAIGIAKHGVFGDDAVGFSLSHPSANMLGGGFDNVAGLGDLPPVFVASGHVTPQAPETDLQLGYVTSFDGGALALQANASYQMNYQGQTGATSLSILSRAKIKF
jgi:hypothetical protein